MEIYLNTGHFFAVPSAVAEHFLKLASGDQLKVLLYVLCHADAVLTAEQIAAQCGVQPSAVEEALAFWQSVNIIRGSAEAAPAEVRTAAQSQAAEPVRVPETAAGNEVPVRAAVQATSASWALRPSEIAARKEQNKAVAEMFAAAEQLAGRPLNHTELQSLLWMHEYLGLQPDLVMMLAAYCIEIGCFQVRYMEKIALEWQERGILTHEAAQQDIQRMETARSFTGRVMRIFEMSRRPTPKQQAYIDGWLQKNFSPEMIRLAYEKTRDAADDKLSFPYLDSILQRWAAAGIQTVEAAEQDEAAFQAAKQKRRPAAGQGGKGKTSRRTQISSIDPDEIEKLIGAY
ncbi:MAG: DnaD domain protein [Oscillospiraceae bacterium]|nr:DnaD domain protein [Oscillospiraceae bacterium]